MTSFNVAGLLAESPGATREARLRDHYVTLGPDVELAGPMDADLRIQRTNRGILLRGTARAPLLRTCARCLDTYVEDVEVSLDEEYLPTIDPAAGTVVEPPPGEEPTSLIDGHHEIDLRPLLHDELALTEPMHPLCRPDCPGLCSVCGLSLAGDAHDHGAEELDPRLAALAQLLEREQ
jgi:uncharacterized protein